MQKTVLYISAKRGMLASELNALLRHPNLRGGNCLVQDHSPKSAAEHHALVKRLRPVLVVLPHASAGTEDTLPYVPSAESLRHAGHVRFRYDPGRNLQELENYGKKAA